MPDPRNAIHPGGQPPGNKATEEQKRKHGAPTIHEVRSDEKQPPGDSGMPEREAATISGAHSSPKMATKGERARAKQPALQSLGDLLRATYGGRRLRLNPKKAEISAMRSATKLEPSQREELLGLSCQDRILEKTRELMLLSAERFDAPILSGQVCQFVGEVLRRHPAFLAASLVGALENRADEPSEEGAVRMLASQSYTSFTWATGLAPLNKREAARCRMNAVCCLLLWLRETRGTALEAIQRHLQSSIWEPAARHHNSDLQKLRALATTRDPVGIGVACSALVKEALEQNRLAAAAQKAEAGAVMKAEGLKDEIDSLNTKLEAARTEVGHLTQEIAVMQRSHENEKAHIHNEYEQLRGRVLRRLREEVSLLDEGLHALRRNPPKVHVMEDHAERAIDGLKREMERIKGDD